MRYFILLISIFSFIRPQELTFPKEDITFSISDSHFTVEGNYLFRNAVDNPIQRRIYYPFPSESEFGFVDSVNVIDLTKDKIPVIERVINGLFFDLVINAKDSLLIHIIYRQKFISDSVKYILTTTKFWNKPFEIAEYKLVVDPSMEIVKFSYKPDKEYFIGGKEIYYWKKKNFMPDKDMVFHFERK